MTDQGHLSLPFGLTNQAAGYAESGSGKSDSQPDLPHLSFKVYYRGQVSTINKTPCPSDLEGWYLGERPPI